MATTQNFALDILQCPPSGAIKQIVYSSPTKLCVTQGSETLMCIDLKDFFVQINDAQKTSFTIPGQTSTNIPLSQNLFNFCGLGSTVGAKYASFFFSYPSGTASSNQQFVEWAFEKEIVSGPLAILNPVIIDNSGSTAGATGSDTMYRFGWSEDVVKIDGTKFGLSSTLAFAVATKGGLEIWSETDGTILLNTFNSNIPSNQLSSLTYAPNGILWVGTSDSGIFKLLWNDNTFSFDIKNIENSPILSDVINDIDIQNDILAIATDKGLSVYNLGENTWVNFSNKNVNSINDESFSSVVLDYPYLISGASSGAYVHNIVNNDWSKYDNSTQGWTITSAVNRLISHQQEVFVATEEGIVTFSIGATVCAELNLPVGPTSIHRNISDLQYVTSSGLTGSDFLYASSLYGEIFEYEIDIDAWNLYPGVTGDPLQNGINRFYVDSEVYFTNDSGFSRIDITGGTGASAISLPLPTQFSDILFSYPSDGSFPAALDQKIYIGFSKPVDSDILKNHIVFENAATGATIGYSISSTDSKFYQITPESSFSYSTAYHFQIVPGLTSTDSKLFRQAIDTRFISYDKNPINGWNVAGKQLTLSGADGHYVDSLIFRNPHPFNVTVNALIAV